MAQEPISFQLSSKYHGSLWVIKVRNSIKKAVFAVSCTMIGVTNTSQVHVDTCGSCH